MAMNKRDGILLMYSIPTRPTYRRDELAKMVEKHDLDPSLVPKGTAPSDKFRKACREVINRPEWRSLEDQHGRKVKLQWTVVPTKDSPVHKDKIQYDLMQQVMGGAIDSANYLENPVEHSIFKMFFHKDIVGAMKDRITFQMPRKSDGSVNTDGWVDGVNYPQFIQDVIDQADVYDQEMDGPQATEAIKGYMRRMNATLYRRMRAVWYVPESQVDHAIRFQSAIREWTDGQIDIHNVPIYANQTAELKEFFENNLLDELRGIDEEISMDGKMQDRLIARIQREITEFTEIATAYDGNIDRNKIDAALAVVTGKMTLAMEANLRWKEEKEAEAVRRKEEQKKMMKAKKTIKQKQDSRMSVL
jgi:hypothetical protein